jgi:hypothetical protein
VAALGLFPTSPNVYDRAPVDDDADRGAYFVFLAIVLPKGLDDVLKFPVVAAVERDDPPAGLESLIQQ